MSKFLSVAVLGCGMLLVMAGCGDKSGSGATGDAPAGPAVPKVDFASAVQPIFEENCYKCHGPEERVKGDLRLDTKELAMKGGESGVVILPGDSAGSLLVKLINGPHDDIKQMPAKGDPLTAEQIEVLAKWIDEGAKWPEA